MDLTERCNNNRGLIILNVNAVGITNYISMSYIHFIKNTDHVKKRKVKQRVK